MLNLRPYQSKGVNDIRASYQQKFRAPLYTLPTGGGKTVLFSHIAANVAARSKRALILVHRIELLRQTADKLRSTGCQVGLINPMYTPNLRAPIQVASVQTLVRRTHWNIPGFDLIVTDECHHVISSTYRTILNQWPNALNLGVTATPVRGDGLGLGVNVGGVYDTLIQGPQVGELIDMGYLVRPVVYAPKQKLDLTGLRTVAGDWNKKQLAERTDSREITGSAVDHYSKICPGQPCVVFCCSIAHAEHVAAEFRGAGYRAFSADGSMPDEQRVRLLGGLANGDVEVLTTCDLISEGTDIPAISCAILLRATQSLGLYIQQVGRALRPAPGKDKAVILDHVGNVLTHGLPDEDREWTLDGEMKRRREKGDEEAAMKVKQCPECYAVHMKADPTCPECGYLYPPPKGRHPEQVDGELALMTEEHRRAVRRVKDVEVARTRTLEDLQKLAADRGYKPGWAEHVMAAREKKERPG